MRRKKQKKMKTLKCNKCNKIINNAPDNWDRNEKCLTCNGYFSEINQNNSGLGISNVTENIPHIYLGKEGFSTSNQPKPNKTQKSPNSNTQKDNLECPEDDKGYKLYENIRKWAFIVLLCLVIGYAGYRIILAMFGA